MKNGSTILKRSLLGAAVLLMSSSLASATPADCTLVTTLAQLLADNAVGGCQHLDKIFSNFAYSLSDASLVTATHEFTAGADSTQSVHGWNFARTTGTWTTGFTLSYDVTVDTVNFPFQRIFAVTDQENSGLQPNSTSITDTETVTNPAGQTQILVVTGGCATGCLQSNQGNFSPLAASIHTSSVFTPGTGGQLTSYEQQWYERSNAVPEPGTMALGGAALLLLGWFGKRRSA